jgi:hypothetical protein
MIRLEVRISLLIVGIATAASLSAQGPPQAPAGAARSPRATAPIDLTGNWVSIVTEDWRYRMVTPAKGDYASVPINAEGRRVADTWDPAKDEAAGEQCRSYGAAGIMRVPTRLRISWQDDNTLKIDTDAGTQTRLLRFGESQPPAAASWQGHSAANWEYAGGRGAPGAPPGGRGGDGGGRGAGGAARGAPPPPQGGSLKVATSKMKAGYLRKNGVPYSENASVTEYFDRFTEPNGDEWFVVTTIVDDSKFLQQPFITSTHFKKDPDPSKWNPTPCKAR